MCIIQFLGEFAAAAAAVIVVVAVVVIVAVAENRLQRLF
jgi:hypothetical protein